VTLLINCYCTYIKNELFKRAYKTYFGQLVSERKHKCTCTYFTYLLTCLGTLAAREGVPHWYRPDGHRFDEMAVDIMWTKWFWTKWPRIKAVTAAACQQLSRVHARTLSRRPVTSIVQAGLCLSRRWLANSHHVVGCFTSIHLGPWPNHGIAQPICR